MPWLKSLLTSRGSSPRVRGTPWPTWATAWRTGIIPACEGNTLDLGANRRCRGDHPRVCGEHSPNDLPGAHPQGSSPRLRGTRPHRPRWHSGQGIIPACAGNTWTEGLRPGDAGDHPRVCGEHAPPLACLFDARGSSPRVRGTLRRRRRARAEIGIIPACAGNTSRPASRWSWGRDHPRVCGEHEIMVSCLTILLGSSPRVRGTRRQ